MNMIIYILIIITMVMLKMFLFSLFWGGGCNVNSKQLKGVRGRPHEGAECNYYKICIYYYLIEEVIFI